MRPRQQGVLPDEENHYFPSESLQRDHHGICPWKDAASYRGGVVGDELHASAAWYYPQSKDATKQISSRATFRRGCGVVA